MVIKRCPVHRHDRTNQRALLARQIHTLTLEVLEQRYLLATFTVTQPTDEPGGAPGNLPDTPRPAVYGVDAASGVGSDIDMAVFAGQDHARDFTVQGSELVSKAQVPSLSASGSSNDAAVSADGRYVVFVSVATNLVPDMDILPGLRNVYRHDRLTGQVDLVSVNADGTASGNGESFDPVISVDGTVVAFISRGSDLHQLDTDSEFDVFARSLVTGTTELVSVNADGTASGNFTSSAPAISADGMVVAFASSASDLHPLDTDTMSDVFTRSLVQGTTELVSVNAAGTASGNDASFPPVISADGAVVAFRSRASDLHPLDTDTGSDVFARSLVTGTTELVSVNTAGTASGNDDSYDPVISADGAVVAFWSGASDLHQLDTDTSIDVFARSLVTGTTDLVSVNADGTASGNFISFRPVISADGTVVAFQSDASDLHPLDTDVSWDILARNLVTRTTDLVSVNADGTAGGNSHSYSPVINADGTVVAFESRASDLQRLDTDTALDVFARSLVTDVTELVSGNATGTASGNDDSFDPVISADGTVVAFESPASDLVGGDLNGFLDVFRWQLGTAATSIVSAVTPTQMSRSTSAYGLSEDATVSADGRYVVFVSDAVNLAPGMDILPGLQNVYRHDRLTGQVDLVSVNAAGTASGNGDSFDPAISADGTIVAFESSASDLHPLDNDTRRDILARSLVTGTTELVSVNAAGTASGNGDSYDPVISADGAVVAFWSRASDLHQLDTNTMSDVFARRRVTGTTELVSVNADGTASGNSSSLLPVINADGTVVAFQSQAADLNPLDADNDSDVFARSLVTGTTELVSVNAAGTASGIGHSFDPVISADGIVVAFQSQASDLHPLDTDTMSDVFARSLVKGTTQLVSVNAGGIASGNRISFAPVISADGTVVAFQSQATDLHPLDTDTMSDVFARSLVQGTTELVSISAAGTASGNFDSRAPVISADGTVVAFLSYASDLHPLDTDSGIFSGDIFSRSLVQGTTELASVSAAGTASGNFTSRAPAISADGRVVAFQSDASDLVNKDFNYNRDVFSFRLYDHIVVDNADDVVDANYSPGELSLREAIALANTTSGVQKITFASTLDGAEIDLAFGFLAIEQAVIIDASALNKGIIIDAQLTSRIFQVGSAADYVLMDGLNLKRGRTTGADGGGGAIRSLMSGPLVIRNSVIHDSQTLGNDAHGGAVFTIGDLHLQSSIIESNSTQGTGGHGRRRLLAGRCYRHRFNAPRQQHDRRHVGRWCSVRAGRPDHPKQHGQRQQYVRRGCQGWCCLGPWTADALSKYGQRQLDRPSQRPRRWDCLLQSGENCPQHIDR